MKCMRNINIVLVNGYIIYIHLNSCSEIDLGGEAQIGAQMWYQMPVHCIFN